VPIGLPRIEPAALGLEEEHYQRLRTVFDVQSCVFASEVLPSLWSLYPSGVHTLSLLDIGSRTGAGSELLRYIHHPGSFSRIKLIVTALDVDDTYIDYSRVHFPELRYLQEDIFNPNFAERFDLVLCSHTIEHVNEPLAFLRRAQELARQWLIVATPFDEKDLIPGHLHRLGFEFFQEAGAHNLKVYRSLTWHGSMACIAVFHGACVEAR
jgi:2-polyprenyl-3-methyl-5-hydroxy-6-metoxy-1,4-benzoquinol methylase